MKTKKRQLNSCLGVDMTSFPLRAVRVFKENTEMVVDLARTEVVADETLERRFEALERLLAPFKSEAKGMQLQISVDESVAPIKFTTFPVLPDEELKNAIQLHIEGERATAQKPLRIEHFICDKGRHATHVGFVQISIEMIERLVSLCDSVGCPLDGLEPEAISLAHCCRTSGQLIDPRVAVLTLHRNQCKFHVLSPEFPSFTRALPEPSVRKMMTQEKVPALAAAALTLPGAAPSEVPQPPSPARPLILPPHLEEESSPSISHLRLLFLAFHIRESLNYLEYEMLAPKVAKLLLVGKPSMAPGVADEFQKALGIPTESLLMPPHIRHNLSELDPRVFGIALGAALGLIS